MKFATHVLVFGQGKWIMRNIANAYPHVDKIYVSYSEEPWVYNSSARLKYKNDFDSNILFNSPYSDKICLLPGKWNTEEEQRNYCADQATRDGMDFLIIHDADEFYFHEDFEKIKQYIVDNSNRDYYMVGWYCFWKSFNYILLDHAGKEIVGYPEFAINLRRGVRFQSKRRPNKVIAAVIPSELGICYHGSYVLSNEEVKQKIETWGHANDFDRDHWYRNIWLGWTEEMRNLHLVNPPAWSQARKFTGKLPEVIEDMK